MNRKFQLTEPVSVTSPEGTIGAEIRRRAETQPDHPAIISSGFAPLSYRELQVQIDQIRNTLRQRGYGRGAKIAIAMQNGPLAALTIVAVSCAAVCIPLNPRQTLPEAERCLAALRPDAVILMHGDTSAAGQAALAMGISVIELNQTRADVICVSPVNRLIKHATFGASDEPDSDAIAFILQTSGTTSESKLIPTKHRNMLAAAARVQAWFDLTPQDRCLSASPVFYAHGLHVTVFAVLLSGGTIAFPTDATKLDFSEWFEELRPTWYSAGPTLHRLVYEQIKSRAVSANSALALRLIVSGGAPLPDDLSDGLHHLLGVPVLEHYGSSEGMQICANQIQPGRSKAGTCGIPWPNTIRIVSDDGRFMTPGEQGEILVGGPTVVGSYCDAPELSQASFIDGWFRSGDIGSIDKDGFLMLHGRKNDLINRGGEKISPAEIDELLLKHPSIAEAAAFSVPHPRLGEDIAAAVVLHPGMTATATELRQYIQKRAASFKIPRRIMIVDRLPKGATGKVLRRQLPEFLQSILATEPQASDANSAEGDTLDHQLVMQLATLWERLLKTSPITIDDDFFEKGGDSLLAMDMLAELEVLAGESIPASVLLEAYTIRQLAHKISERRRAETNYNYRLVPLNSGGNKTPLFFFHGDFIGGGATTTTKLADLLGPDQPLFAVAPHGADGSVVPDSIEAMAVDRLAMITKAQPQGPYRICGNCLGGIVAFEVARQLVRAGQEVETVCMIDPPTINSLKSLQVLMSIMKKTRPILGPAVDRGMARIWYRSTEIQKFLNVPWTRRWSALKNRLRKRDRQAIIAAAAERSNWNPEISPFGKFADALTTRYAGAMSSYIPKHLAARVVYISIDYGPGKWGEFYCRLQSCKDSGNHYFPDIPRIAEVLRESLLRNG